MSKSIIPDRLNELFIMINNCELVKNRVITDNSINSFIELLNKAQPKDMLEVCAKRTLFDLLQINSPRSPIYANIMFNRDQNNGFEKLVLWTGPRSILKKYRLQEQIFLRWDKGTLAFFSRKKRNIQNRTITMTTTATLPQHLNMNIQRFYLRKKLYQNYMTNTTNR